MYINKRITHSFPCINFAKPLCDNVLQPEPRSSEGCNTSHSGLANVNTEKNASESVSIFVPTYDVLVLMLFYIHLHTFPELHEIK